MYSNVFIYFLAHFDAKAAGDMSTLFDVGGILGRKHFQLIVNQRESWLQFYWTPAVLLTEL